MEKIIKFSRVLWKIIDVLLIVCVASAIGYLIMAVVVAFLPDELLKYFTAWCSIFLDLGMVNVKLTEPIVIQEAIRPFFYAFSAYAIVSLAVYGYGFHLLRNILLTMSKSLPFKDVVSTNLRKLSVLVLVGNVVMYFVNNLRYEFQYRMFDLSNLFSNDLVASYSMQKHALNLSVILIAVLLFVLSCVFKYGEELQKLSDETL